MPGRQQFTRPDKHGLNFSFFTHVKLIASWLFLYPKHKFCIHPKNAQPIFDIAENENGF